MGTFTSDVSTVFNVKGSQTFIAEADDTYSGYYDKDHFSRERACKEFEAGRYVIVVYQIHSIYMDGKQIWLNEHFENAVGRDSRYRQPCFVIITDKLHEYMIPSWGRSYFTHIIHNDKDPLQVKIFSLEEARQFAVTASGEGHKIAVMEWFEDYDMY